MFWLQHRIYVKLLVWFVRIDVDVDAVPQPRPMPSRTSA